MALKIRLRRMGRKKAPTYRIVVAESSSPRDGRFVANLGHYNPRTEPTTLVVDRERSLEWLAKGAMPTETVHTLLRKAGVFSPAPTVVETAVEAVKSTAKKATKSAGAAASKAAGAVAHVAVDVKDAVAHAAVDVKDTVQDAVGAAVDTVQDAVSSVVEAVRERVSGGDEEEAPAAAEAPAAEAEGTEAEKPE
jgi:small subunit ribosomal protein S16